MRLSTIRPLIFEEEAVKNCGEDSYFVRCKKDGIVTMGVFDGCGGIGGRRYPKVNNRTGAWIGSQVAAYAADMFSKNNKFFLNRNDAAALQAYISKKLKSTKQKITQFDEIQIGGTLNKALPTTVSIIIAQQSDTNELLCECVWAGDSRGFLLDRDGLCQLTTDDIDMNADDAFANLREDGILTNVANGDGDFVLHSGVVQIKSPVMLISATDGCFGYFLTPMDFENIILKSLVSTKNPTEWRKVLCENIKAVTGDDYTMTVACFGFDSFEQMQMYYIERQRFLTATYINKQVDKDEIQLRKLWEKYKSTYYRCRLNVEF